MSGISVNNGRMERDRSVGIYPLAGLRTGGLDPEQVFSLYQDQQLICLAPDLDFEAQRRFREGSQSSELIDYFAENFARGS